jgi:hypothetical protein
LGKAYLHVFILGKIFSRTSRPISAKLGTNHPWVKEIQIVKIKGDVLLKREVITKMQKFHEVNEIFLPLRTTEQSNSD